MEPVVPFLKWPGGKRWFILHHAAVLPRIFGRYFEPFLGAGSVYFHLRPHQATLADVNEELLTTYLAIRDDWEIVAAALRRHQAGHNRDDGYYYKIRATRPTTPAGRAARLIYLNRTCFNGIYRVSLRGEFNVPKGTKSSVILPTDDFRGLAELLQGTELVCSDFESIIDRAGAGDFVFADPPYTIKHNNNGFIKYNEKLFSWQDQERLAAALARARDRDATVVATNAAHVSVKRLYRRHGFSVQSVKRFSSIASASARRDQFEEVIIRRRRKENRS